MLARIIQFFAIVLLAIYLIPLGAHLFALPNKIGLDRDSYVVVQAIYFGWNLFGAVLAGALAATLALIFVMRGQGLAFALAIASFAGILMAAIVFFVLVLPANQATASWTALPQDWQALRTRWEYGHAASALATFAALLAATGATLTDRRR